MDSTTNHMDEVTSLRNRYFGFRHGESIANVTRRILSDPTDGTRSGGLTPVGCEEVKQTILAAKGSAIFSTPAILYSSDFLRAQETAAIIADALDTTFNLTPQLRERYFGIWDNTSDANYQLVWEDDAAHPDQERNGVESVTRVLERTTALIAELELKYSGRDIILVSHGDTLRILQTAFQRCPPADHLSLPYFHLAELRAFLLQPLPAL